MKLKDKVAIVTGGGTGIGKEIAMGYAREGADVVVVARNEERLKKVSAEIKKIGRRTLAIGVDVQKRDDIDAMVDQVMDEFGKIDILVNNAAIYPARPFLDVSEEQMIQVIDINLMGVFRCTQAVAKEMVRKKYGKIISITSGQAFLGISLMSDYTAAKGGIVALTRAVAAELSPLGINVNALSPGLTTTDTVNESLPKGFRDDFARAMALRRLATPDEYVGAAVLLASDEGGYITGSVLSVDGGMSSVMAPVVSGFSE